MNQIKKVQREIKEATIIPTIALTLSLLVSRLDLLAVGLTQEVTGHESGGMLSPSLQQAWSHISFFRVYILPQIIGKTT